MRASHSVEEDPRYRRRIFWAVAAVLLLVLIAGLIINSRMRPPEAVEDGSPAPVPPVPAAVE